MISLFFNRKIGFRPPSRNIYEKRSSALFPLIFSFRRRKSGFWMAVFIDFRWFSVFFNRFAMIFIDFQWFCNDFQWICNDFAMIFIDFAMIFNDFLWFLMIFTDFLIFIRKIGFRPPSWNIYENRSSAVFPLDIGFWDGRFVLISIRFYSFSMILKCCN